MLTATDMDVTKDRAKLDAFLVDNPELEALNAQLASFNLFRVLRIEKAEIRHSNVLAWLLAPGESHGLGAHFLRRFLSRLLMTKDLSVELAPAQVELMSFDDVEVYREWRDIDVLVRSRTGDWCLVIENKIGSRESRGQLAKYKQAVQDEFAHAHLMLVYLTPEGDEPSAHAQELGYVTLSHIEVLGLCDRIFEQNRSRIPPDAATFLTHYVSTLRRLTMQDADLIELCKAIYRKHRDAVDLIVEYGAASQVIDACENRLQELVQCEFVKTSGQWVWFLPTEMGEAEPTVELANEWRFLPRHVPVMCWCAYHRKQGKLQMVIEVGPLADGELRRQLLTAIKDGGISFWEKWAFAPGAKFTRIVSEIRKLRLNEDGDPDDDPEYIKKLTDAMWDKTWEQGKRIAEVLKSFEWPATPES